MEELLQSLRDVGYEGALLDSTRLHDALEKGPKSTDFTSLIAWLSEQLSLFGNFDERIHPTTSPDDSSSFLLELNTFLKELGCVNTQLMSGNINQRLSSRNERILLIDYLISELMASKIVEASKPESCNKLEVEISESDTAKSLREMLVALQFEKPPDNISAQQLFTKLENKLKNIVSSVSKDHLGKPLIIGELSKDQWERIDKLQEEKRNEYKCRREMLLTRLDVTVQSFLWSDRIKAKEDQLNSCYKAKRDKLSSEPNVTIAQLLAARDDVAIIEKTSSASVRRNTQSNVTKVIIGEVPDRGGRTSEQAPPPPEMPSWQKDRVPDAPRGGRGGGRGGGGRGGGGGGNYRDHKDSSSNFGQNRDWQDKQQAPGFYGGDNGTSGYQRGGGSGQQGGYNRGGRGRVQGGWAQGGGGYNRGRSHY